MSRMCVQHPLSQLDQSQPPSRNGARATGLWACNSAVRRGETREENRSLIDLAWLRFGRGKIDEQDSFQRLRLLRISFFGRGGADDHRLCLGAWRPKAQ